MSGSSRRFTTRPGGGLSGTARVPGDKSISHRAVMLGALADGVTEVTHFLDGADCLATRAAFAAMGVRFDDDGGVMRVHGVGLDGLQAPDEPLDLGNSGTSMRLLCGLLAGQRFDTTLIGDASLTRRPMRRVTEPLARMGARIETTDAGTAPLTVRGGQPLRGERFDLSIASAQVKSALLLAGLYADGTVTVHEPGISRDHSERMLTSFGVDVGGSGQTCSLTGGQRLVATAIEVPGDLSSAAFPIIAACVTPGSAITLTGVGVNPSRAGLLKILEMMGANLALTHVRAAGSEPVADITVEYSPLMGVEIPPNLVPLAIDEFPAVLAAAAVARGVTSVSGAEELRVKESDRIAAMARGLEAVGVSVSESADGIAVTGGGLRGGTVDALGDHRIAMAFAALGAVSPEPLIIRDVANVATSFPNFPGFMAGLGLHVDVGESDE